MPLFLPAHGCGSLPGGRKPLRYARLPDTSAWVFWKIWNFRGGERLWEKKRKKSCLGPKVFMTPASWACRRCWCSASSTRSPCSALRCWYPSSRVSMCLRLCCLRAWARCCSTLSQKGRCLRFSVPALRFWAAMLRLHRLALTERPARCCRMRQAAW